MKKCVWGFYFSLVLIPKQCKDIKLLLKWPPYPKNSTGNWHFIGNASKTQFNRIYLSTQKKSPALGQKIVQASFISIKSGQF